MAKIAAKTSGPKLANYLISSTILIKKLIFKICNMKDSKKILSDIKQVIKNKYPDTQIFLYGSKTIGTVREDSDWGLLILLNQEKITPFYNNVMKEGREL